MTGCQDDRVAHDSPGAPGWRAAQRAALLGFLAGARHPLGFGYLGDDGTVDAARPVELWITCRMTHVAALGLLRGEGPAALPELAAHGVTSLLGPLRDGEYAGWFAAVGDSGPVDSAKQAYGHAFVVLAATSAVAADVAGGEELLAAALAVSRDRFWDDDSGLSLEEWDRSWTTLDDYRGVNANMHTVEAYLAAGDLTDEPGWHQCAARISARVAGWAAANDWRIPEHFTPRWEPMLEHHLDHPAHPFRPYGATIGHGLEWARLLLAVDGSLGDGAPPGLRAAAVALYDRAVADGWAADGADGFVYTTDWAGEPVVRQRMHWVVCEAIGAAEALRKVTGEQRYADDLARWWAYAAAHLVDHAHGSWHHELDPGNRPAGTVWPGKPDVYHAYQALLVEDLPLVPSFAAALAQR
jgi:mannose/cellobiose epimerase-like protein (N-acyl-D-glucosamine 2-epimerase family)